MNPEQGDTVRDLMLSSTPLTTPLVTAPSATENQTDLRRIQLALGQIQLAVGEVKLAVGESALRQRQERAEVPSQSQSTLSENRSGVQPPLWSSTFTPISTFGSTGSPFLAIPSEPPSIHGSGHLLTDRSVSNSGDAVFVSNFIPQVPHSIPYHPNCPVEESLRVEILKLKDDIAVLQDRKNFWKREAQSHTRAVEQLKETIAEQKAEHERETQKRAAAECPPSANPNEERKAIASRLEDLAVERKSIETAILSFLDSQKEDEKRSRAEKVKVDALLAEITGLTQEIDELRDQKTLDNEFIEDLKTKIDVLDKSNRGLEKTVKKLDKQCQELFITVKKSDGQNKELKEQVQKLEFDRFEAVDNQRSSKQSDQQSAERIPPKILEASEQNQQHITDEVTTEIKPETSTVIQPATHQTDGDDKRSEATNRNKDRVRDFKEGKERLQVIKTSLKDLGLLKSPDKKHLNPAAASFVANAAAATPKSDNNAK